MTSVIIDFNSLPDIILTGKLYGENIRNKLLLDEYDKTDQKLTIIIPEKVYSISNSFILGFLSKSIIKANNKNSFYEKYEFIAKPLFKIVIDSCVTRVLLEKELKNRNPQ